MTMLVIVVITVIFGSCEDPNAGKSKNVTIEMISVPGGSFQMGNPDSSVGYPIERPVHTVTLSAFSIGKYEVTQAQYQTVVGINPCYFRGDNLPVENVTWYDAVEFCNKLSEIQGYQPVYTITGRSPAKGYPVTFATVTADWAKNGYRLPTEAEWEYAARGGNEPPENYLYPGSNDPDKVAWYTDNSNSITHEVGTKAPNSLGLYDMGGNVWEWCWDWYEDYPSEAQTDPRGASSGSDRIERGGGWGVTVEKVRSAYRSHCSPSDRYADFGFRLVRP